MAKKKEENTQLDFGFKNPIRNIIAKYFHNISLRIAYLETKQFLRNPLTWIFALSIVFLIGYQVYLIYQVQNFLPAEVPLLYYLLDLGRRLFAKEYLYVLPIISGAMVIFSARFSYVYFYKSKELAFFILASTFLAILLLTLSLLRLVAPFYA
jgi:hypothetical protein